MDDSEIKKTDLVKNKLEAEKIWDEFEYNIKYKNRFFPDPIVPKMLEEIIKYSGGGFYWYNNSLQS